MVKKLSQKQTLRGFIVPVTLSTGAVVRIRKVDLTTMQNASMTGLVTLAHAQAGREHAEQGAQFLRNVMREIETAPDAIPEELLQFPELILGQTRQADLSLMRAACVEPTLPELVELYEGDMDAPDCGLGPDYSLLLAYIRQHSRLIPPTAQEVAQALMFPAADGTDTGGDGEGVRETPE